MAHQDQGTSPQEDRGLDPQHSEQAGTERAQQKAQSAESHPYPEEGQPPSSGNPAQTARREMQDAGNAQEQQGRSD